MSDSEPDSELEEIRRKKLQELQGDETAGDEGAAGDGGAAPDEAVELHEVDGYQEFVERHDVVLVDFRADWCGPCKMLDPIVEELAAETDAAVLEVDIDAHQRLAQQMRVQGVPTLHLYADGEQVEKMVGVQDKATLRKLIDRHLP